MAFLLQQNIPALDPNLFTGPTRATSGPARFLAPTLDVQYGELMRFIYVGTTGNVAFIAPNGNTVTLTGLVAGVFHPIWSLQINSSGTTAANIIVAS